MRFSAFVAAILVLAGTAMAPAAGALGEHHAVGDWLLRTVACPGADVEDALGHCVPGPLVRGSPSYGAIAATASTGDFFGSAVGYASRREAEREALHACNQNAGKEGACMVATWFRNECGALAQGRNGNWGANWADTEKLAAAKAMADCRDMDRSGACHVVTSYCSH